MELEDKFENLKSENDELRNQVDDLGQVVRMLNQQVEDLTDKLKQVGESSIENRQMNIVLVSNLNNVKGAVKEMRDVFSRISREFEHKVYEAVKAQQGLIEEFASAKQDDKFDETIKALIEETQKNEINKVVEKFQHQAMRSGAEKSKAKMSNQTKMVLAMASSAVLVFFLMFLALKFFIR